MAQQFDGKVFVTTTAKAQAVKNLLEYWTMKTELLRKRQDPTVFASKGVQQKTKDYLVKNTKLREKSFFNNLSEEDQEKLTKCFTMQEVPKAKKEIIARNRLKAVVYICLSGHAVVRNMKTDTEVRYGVGEVFGSVDQFRKVMVEGEEMVDGHPDDQGTPEEVIDFGEGTFVRMELNEIYNTIIRTHPDELAAIAEIKEQESAVEISGIAWEKMSEDDKFYVRVYKRTKELVNKRFFSFLDSYRMIPKNATMAAYRYYHEGNKGREIYLDRRDQTWVFVFIDGSVKLELCATKVNGTEHTVSYLRKQDDDNHMHIKKKTMPLMLLSAGSVMCIHPECFALADEEDGDADDYESIVSQNLPQESGKNATGKQTSKFRSRFPPSRTGSPKHGSRRGGHMSSDSTVASGHTLGTIHTANSSIDSHMHRRSDVFVPRQTPPDIADAQYHIKLVFESTTTYLAVPYANFARILDDNRLILPKIAKEIKWYLRSPSDQIRDRIARLLPWVRGNIDFNQRGKTVKVSNTLDFVPAELGPRHDDLTAPLGSFSVSHAAGTEGEGNSEFRTSTPKLAPPAPSHKEAPPSFSFKNATRTTSAQDQTMNSMLLELRKSRDMSQKASTKSVLPLRSSMFMTQDMEGDFSIVEESAHDSDSDVDVNDFRPKKKALGGVSAKRSEVSDSTNSMKSEPVLNAVSLHAPMPSSEALRERSLTEEEGPLRKVIGISVLNSANPSLLEIAGGDGEEVDLQSLN